MSIDRILAAASWFVVVVSVIMTLANFHFSWSWALLALWTIALAIWTGSGGKKVEIGWGGQLLFLSERLRHFFKEGWRWAPWPFDIKMADCRKQTLSFEVLEATTKDNVPVFVGGSVVYRVVDLDMYFDAEKADVEKWIDNTRKQVIRTRVRTLTQTEVLDAHESLGGEMVAALRKEDSTRWGIEIIEVIIPEISPDPEVAKDLALKERETLQRRGQTEEAKNISDLIKLFKKPAPGGSGMTHGEAVEMAQLVTGKAAPKNLTGFSFSPEIMEAIAKIVRRS